MEHKFLLQVEVANRWRISERTLERWRYEGRGPRPTKIGGRVVYAREEIERFELAGFDGLAR